MTSIAVVILNYCTPQLVINCLQSLVDEVGPDDCAVVVDNASPDRSAAQIAQAIENHGWQDWVQLVVARENRGFSAGNNLGISTVAADAYLLLNSDTLLQPGALKELRQTLAAYPTAGVISPRLEWPDGEPQISCFRYVSPLSELIVAARTGPLTRVLKTFDVPQAIAEHPTTYEWTSFAAVLLRQTLIAEIGLLDEGYFMYFEDVDYCRRARAAGWQVLHNPQARIVHLRGGTSDVKAATAARRRRPAYYYAARARYFAKFYGGFAGIIGANLAWYAGRSIAWLREKIGNKQPHTCQMEARDIWINWNKPLTST